MLVVRRDKVTDSVAADEFDRTEGGKVPVQNGSAGALGSMSLSLITDTRLLTF